jgi:CRP-like cAMP-binding protein
MDRVSEEPFGEGLFGESGAGGLWTAARPRIRVLEVDPDLGRALDGERLAAATHHLTAPVCTLMRGAWQPDDASDGERLGLLVASGVLMRSHLIGKVVSAELLGAGDVIRPALPANELATIEAESRWQVVSDARLLILDAPFLTAAMRWPEVMLELFDRNVLRARFIAFQMAVSHVRRVDARILLLFWRLADRWGRVTRDGVVVPLPLTHASIGVLVGAQRPSVTTALKHLRDAGELTRRTDGTWLLEGAPPDTSTRAFEPLAGPG